MTLTSFLALFWQRSQENKLTQAARIMREKTLRSLEQASATMFKFLP